MEKNVQDFGDENVLLHAAEAFAETVALKVKQLRRYVPKKKDETNPDVTGAYIEELVRGFLKNWIGHQEIVHGTFYNKNSELDREIPLQIDGIVHDPRMGPRILSEGSFGIVHPAFCSGVIEIKTSISGVKPFEDRLQDVHKRYLSHLPSTHVMGIVITNSDPENSDTLVLDDDKVLQYHNYYSVPLCPIFFLFKETDEGIEPFMPAIESLIRAAYGLRISTTYI